MSGVKGRSGTNKGKDKPWADALRIVGFREDPEGRKRLLGIAEKCYAAAEAGEIAAMKEIGDRLDGKPVQEQDVTFNDKRDSTDWTRAELVAFLSERRANRERVAQANGRGGEPDSVH